MKIWTEMAQNKGSCAVGDNCDIPYQAFIDQRTKYKMPQNDYATGSYCHAIFQPYVPFFTWNYMGVSYLNNQNSKIPGEGNLSGC